MHDQPRPPPRTRASKRPRLTVSRSREYDYQDGNSFTDRESGFYGLWYRPAYTRLNIGWLEADKPYPAGAVPTAFVEKLRAVQEVQWRNVCLGLHACDLCPGKEAPEGNEKVRIPGEPGIAHAAPFLITHYITAHDYRPPQLFIDAVLTVGLDAWTATRWPDVPFPWVPDGAERTLEQGRPPLTCTAGVGSRQR